jgi:leader peptidase (prepilin peptidase)/N-methyltransferase
LLIWRVSHGFGFGDVRLAGLIGIVAGSRGGAFALAAFFLGTLVGAAWALVQRRRKGIDEPFAYGPALLLGPLVALLVSWLMPG